MKIKALLVTFLLVLTTASQASVLIEPVLGYNFGEFDAKETADFDKASMSGGGLAYGGRLGYQNLGFQIGLDYLNSTQNFDETGIKSDFVSSEWAAFVGFRFPILLRVYAGYIFAANGAYDVNYADGAGNVSEEKFEWLGGTGAKFGLGWTLLPFLDLNLEYRTVTYEEAEVAGRELDVDTTNDVWMLSVSLPFNF